MLGCHWLLKQGVGHPGTKGGVYTQPQTYQTEQILGHLHVLDERYPVLPHTAWRHRGEGCVLRPLSAIMLWLNGVILWCSYKMTRGSISFLLSFPSSPTLRRWVGHY